MKSEFTPVSLEAEFRQIVSCRQAKNNLDQETRSNKRQTSWIREWLGQVLDFLTGSGGLSIQQRSLPNGRIQWIVYDPDAKDSRTFDTEQAVRVWLEGRYYQ